MAALKSVRNPGLLIPEPGLLDPPPQRIYIGVSGGLDSVVLLDQIHEMFHGNSTLNLSVLHVHHHLQPQADQWADFVAALAVHYRLGFQLMHLDPQDYQGENKEAQARKGRYAFFASMLQQETDYLFLAHHAQDQVETFFLNLQRGAGLAGLAAMPYIRPFGKGFLVRPLLYTSRSELEQYAKTRQLQWVDDPSNQDIQLNRNFLRHEILPLLNTRWPHFDAHVGSAVLHLQEARTVLEEYLQAELQTIAPAKELDLNALEQLPPNRHRLLLQMWVKQNTGKILSDKQLEVICNEVIAAAPDSSPLFTLPGLQLQRLNRKLLIRLTA